MALTENPEFHDIVLALHESFSPIHAGAVAEGLVASTPAAITNPFATTAPLSAADSIIHDDIIALGLFISTHDMLGSTLDKKMLADLLTFLTPSLALLPYESQIAAMDAQVTKLSSSYVSKEWPELPSLAMAKNWASNHSERKAQAQALVDLFSKLANEFILCDGRVSDADIKFLNDFDQHFAIP